MGIIRQKITFKVSYDKYKKNNTCVGSSNMIVMTDTVDNATEAVKQYWGKTVYRIEVTAVTTQQLLIYKKEENNMLEQLTELRNTVNKKTDSEVADILDTLLKKIK